MLFNDLQVADVKKNFLVPNDFAILFDKMTRDAFDAKGHSKMLAACFLSFLAHEPEEQKKLIRIAASYRSGGGTFSEAVKETASQMGVEVLDRRVEEGVLIDEAGAARNSESPRKRETPPKKPKARK